MKILGIHDGHTSSAALLIDGKIKYAIQEERLTNIKNAGGFPEKSIIKILELEKINLQDLDYVIFSSKLSFPVPNREYTLREYDQQKKILHKIKDYLIFTSLPKFLFNPLYNNEVKKNQKERIKNIQKINNYPINKIIFTDHHMGHAASAYYSSHFNTEKALVLTLDGGGDKLCATVNVAENNQIKIIEKTESGNSIGNIYSRVTYMMGMVPLEHEYKLMGLAPYCSNDMAKKAYNIFKKYLSLNKKKPLKFERHIFNRTFLTYSRIRKDTEMLRFDQIAAGLQMFTEELVINWVKAAIKKTKINKIALAGGVFMNVKLNQKIMELPEVKDIFIMPSCGDESLPIGACQLIYANKTNNTPEPITNIYWGPEFNETQIISELKKVKGIKYKKMKNINSEIGKLISQDKIVARCSGRMEFGARALGNRSILCNAANMDNVRIINMMIKNRDFWMPFAPVMLDSRAKEYIINPKNIKAPYMILTFNTTNKFTEMIGGVQQADLTARPQIISKEYNKDYYEILKEFENRTGRGVLLNTSFNLHGYPLVYGPKEALWVFIKSGLEYLAIGNYLVTK